MRAAAGILLVFALPLCGQTVVPPDEATLQQIQAKAAELKKNVRILKPVGLPNSEEMSKWADVAVYSKAAEWVLRHNEWTTKESARQTLQVIEAGLKRVDAYEDGLTPWRKIRGQPVIRGFVAMDGSVQPYRVTLPENWSLDDTVFRTDLTLHGRDATLTEVKFIAAAENAKPGKPDVIVLEPYGRGNNAYRWAGETDVFECLRDFMANAYSRDDGVTTNNGRVLLRGFSMGGAGAWHIGLHHPTSFLAMAPGAGFTVTRGYVKDLPARLPDYVERCLRIYDAADYAENLVNIPCVAYSGEKDPQIAAVRNIEARLKGFPERLRFRHIIGTGLEHKIPPEWKAKVDAQLKEFLDANPQPGKMRFVTYTSRYGRTRLGDIVTLEKQYEKAVLEGRIEDDGVKLTTQNILRIATLQPRASGTEFDVDGTKLVFNARQDSGTLVKEQGAWKFEPRRPTEVRRVKRMGLQGPIDDAFMNEFLVLTGNGTAWNPKIVTALDARRTEFARLWDRHFRAELPVTDNENHPRLNSAHIVLFGDPGSHPLIATYLATLPIQWTRESLTVNGKVYDARSHFPALIYPHPNYPTTRYLVLNSGHTFGEADLIGTNALLYPRLGDWAVLKLAPTKDEPHKTEVIDAGIFDENWQFEKKK